MKVDDFSTSTAPSGAVHDAGLRAYMLRIYNYMAGALLLTGALALASSHSSSFLNAMYTMQNGAVAGMKPLGWIVMLAPLGVVLLLSFGMARLSLAEAQLGFWAYAALMGLSLSTIFLVFTGESIARVFFITAAAFAALSLYGYTTPRNLTAMGSFLVMGLVGLIAASLVNLFLKSTGLQFALSVVGILIFAGLTAFDTQKLRLLYAQYAETEEWTGKLAILGALTLYLDFINLFLNLLNLFGQRRQ